MLKASRAPSARGSVDCSADRGLGAFVLSSAYVSGTGLLSLFVVPLLALLTLLAGLLAVVTPVLGS
jgi:hypothetical protein